MYGIELQLHEMKCVLLCFGWGFFYGEPVSYYIDHSKAFLKETPCLLKNVLLTAVNGNKVNKYLKHNRTRILTHWIICRVYYKSRFLAREWQKVGWIAGYCFIKKDITINLIFIRFLRRLVKIDHKNWRT